MYMHTHMYTYIYKYSLRYPIFTDLEMSELRSL